MIYQRGAIWIARHDNEFFAANTEAAARRRLEQMRRR